MIRITDKLQCCGCTACASICVHNAITMQPDTLGFLYPEVNKDKCVGCGLCETVCAFNDHYDTSLNLDKPLAYAARHKDIKEVETSRSGAAFIAISDYVLEHDGVVYGVGYADHFRVVHKRAMTRKARDEFKGSKYVQSDLNNVFRQVKEDLKSGSIVLFSGTPCQTAGLSSYIGEKFRNNLFLVDIVCHGVPSPYIWKDYLAYIERKYSCKVTGVDFRDKQTFGWAAHCETFTCSDGAIRHEKSFTYLFYQQIMFRESCANCPFTNTRRSSDLTIADFWGWERIDSEINSDDKGVSLILENTDKGKRLFESVKQSMFIIPVDLNECLQPNLQYPSIPHPLRDRFESDYMRYGFEYILKKYGDKGWHYKWKTFMRKVNTARRLFIKKISR